jgi:hypothetical protein
MPQNIPLWEIMKIILQNPFSRFRHFVYKRARPSDIKERHFAVLSICMMCIIIYKQKYNLPHFLSLLKEKILALDPLPLLY